MCWLVSQHNLANQFASRPTGCGRTACWPDNQVVGWRLGSAKPFWESYKGVVCWAGQPASRLASCQADHSAGKLFLATKLEAPCPLDTSVSQSTNSGNHRQQKWSSRGEWRVQGPCPWVADRAHGSCPWGGHARAIAGILSKLSSTQQRLWAVRKGSGTQRHRPQVFE